VAVDALITAGGKGTRMRELGGEKPMIPVLGRPLIDYVLDAVRGSRSVGDVYVSVSDNTPLTRAYLKERGVNVIETSGEEYAHDLGQALGALRTDQVLICPADMPLMSSREIDDIIGGYSRSGVESYSVAIPHEMLQRLGARPTTYRFTVDGVDTVLCGISVVDRKKMVSGAVLTEGYLVMRSEGLALNVNTADDLRAAEKRLRERA
jgi:adenosylcobinamide-phosphate guanylyltransferase